MTMLSHSPLLYFALHKYSDHTSVHEMQKITSITVLTEFRSIADKILRL